MTKDQLETALRDPVKGGNPHSYEVLFTDEGVLVLRGAVTPDIIEIIKNQYSNKSGGSWVTEPELAKQIGAKLVMGFPAAIVDLQERIDALN